MKQFSDTLGRAWAIDLNIGALKRVKSLVGVDLLEAKDGRVLAELAEDPIRMVDVLYAICQPQAASRNVSDEQFGSSLDGETVRRAIDAFVDELVGFFLQFRPEIGRVLKALWTRIGTLTAEVGRVALDRVESPAMAAAAARWVEQAAHEIDTAISLGTGSTSSPESSESTPPP